MGGAMIDAQKVANIFFAKKTWVDLQCYLSPRRASKLRLLPSRCSTFATSRTSATPRTMAGRCTEVAASTTCRLDGSASQCKWRAFMMMELWMQCRKHNRFFYLKWGDNGWLREDESGWAVAYHGTSKEGLGGILCAGFRVGERQKFAKDTGRRVLNGSYIPALSLGMWRNADGETNRFFMFFL